MKAANDAQPIRKAIEMSDAKISFVSLVDRPANKRKFLIIKQERKDGTMAKNENVITEEECDQLIDAIADRVIEKLAGDSDDSSIKKAAQKAIEKTQPHYLQGIL